MFSRFFKQNESQVVINALDLLDPLFREQEHYKSIKEKVSNTFSDPAYKNELKKSLYDMKLSPHAIALYAIASVCFKMISTGHFHIYRGAVNLEGNSLKNIFIKCIAELEKAKFFSSEEAKEQIKEIDSVIKETG